MKILGRTARRTGISRVASVVIVIVLFVVAAGAVTYVSFFNSPSPTSSSTTTSSSSSTSSATSAMSSTTTSSSGSTTVNALVEDTPTWPFGDLNQLGEYYIVPFPDWGEYDVYQPLIAVNLTAEFKLGQIQYLPGLATSWTVSPDGRTYTLNLRQGVTFSNGDTFNSYQVWTQMYGFYYLSGNSSEWDDGIPFFNMSSVSFGPSTLSMLTQSGLMNPTQQAIQVMSNQAWPIYVTGPNQISFRLINPFEWFPGSLVSTVGLVVDSQYVLNNGGFGDPTTGINTNFNLNPIPGTGPYAFGNIKQNSYVQLVQNPTYWGLSLTASQIKANPALDPGHAKTVLIQIKPDDLTRYTDVASGSAQIAEIMDNFNIVLANPAKFAYAQAPPASGIINYVNINTQLYPTNITDVRQAIVHAINYTDIIDTAYHGKATPFVGPEYPVWTQFYNLGNTPQYQTNLTLAKQYLAQANIKNMPALTFPVYECGFCETVAQIVQADLAQINITVNIQPVTFDTWCGVVYCNSYSYNAAHPSNVGNLGYPVFFAPSTLTPIDLWVGLMSNQSHIGNTAVYNNPVVQKCANSFLAGLNVSQIQAICTTAQQQIYNDAPYAWIGTNQLWFEDGSLVWQKGVITGMYMDPLYSDFNTEPLFNTVTFG